MAEFAESLTVSESLRQHALGRTLHLLCMHAGKSGWYVGSPEFGFINLGMSHLEENPNVSSFRGPTSFLLPAAPISIELMSEHLCAHLAGATGE